jgi:hypothetical protein
MSVVAVMVLVAAVDFVYVGPVAVVAVVALPAAAWRVVVALFAVVGRLVAGGLVVVGGLAIAAVEVAVVGIDIDAVVVHLVLGVAGLVAVVLLKFGTSLAAASSRTGVVACSTVALETFCLNQG